MDWVSFAAGFCACLIGQIIIGLAFFAWFAWDWEQLIAEEHEDDYATSLASMPTNPTPAKWNETIKVSFDPFTDTCTLPGCDCQGK